MVAEHSALLKNVLAFENSNIIYIIVKVIVYY